MIDGEYRNHINMWLKGAELIGCNDDKVTDEFTPEIMDCLKKADPDDLLSIPEHKEMALLNLVFPFVTIDGKFLPKKPSEMLRTGDFKQNVKQVVPSY